jgi:predicted MPP superfamily phosphohydrolase
MSARARLVAGGALLAAGCAAWGVGFERRWYVLRSVTLPVLRSADAPLRILHVSDLHLLPGQRAVRSFLRGCAATGPDLVVATGDLVGSPDCIDDAVALLAEVRGDRPGLVVLGSNDRYAPRPRNPLVYLASPARRPSSALLDTEHLVDGLRGTGWDVVGNRRTCVQTPAGAVDVLGLDDPHIGRDRPEYVDWTPPGPVALRLGVVHSPYLRVLDRYRDEGFDLVLAGHTHGGQVRIPLLGPLASNCDLPLDQARGPSRHGSVWLHVSAGLGHSRYAPYRFACRPEATVLDLVPAR